MKIKEHSILVNKLFDKQKAGIKKVTNTNFLNELELSICLSNLGKSDNFIISGGLSYADRKMIIFYPNYILDANLLDLPIKAFKITHKCKLSHRDILGSVLGLGIKREKIGDIFAGESESYFLVTLDISEFILRNLFKIGRENIEIYEIAINDIKNTCDDYTIIKDTVKSIRFDSVVASGFKLSRSNALQLILSSSVFLNNQICLKPDFKIKENDKISIRGKGKIVLSSILGTSKKERIFIEIKRFS